MNSPSSDIAPVRPLGDRGAWSLVPLAALAAVYLLFFTDDSPDKFTLDTPPGTHPEPTTAGVAPATRSGLDGTWNVAPGSVAGYRVREKLAALPATSDAVGRTESVTGTRRRHRHRRPAGGRRGQRRGRRLHPGEQRGPA